MNIWYTKSKAEDSQGLIIDETTGKNIAVSYDVKDAQLIAAAPELLEALIAAQQHLEYCGYGDTWERECARDEKLPQKIDAAIAKATEGGK